MLAVSDSTSELVKNWQFATPPTEVLGVSVGSICRRAVSARLRACFLMKRISSIARGSGKLQA